MTFHTETFTSRSMLSVFTRQGPTGNDPAQAYKGIAIYKKLQKAIINTEKLTSESSKLPGKMKTDMFGP